MFEPSYHSAINHISSTLGPSLSEPTKFIVWAEDIAEILSFVYNRKYDQVSHDLHVACRIAQGYDE